MGRKKKQTFGWQKDDPEPKVVERPSRTDRRRVEDERKVLVKALLAVGLDRWKDLPASDALREAVFEAHRLQASHARSGLRRQVLRIGGLLRDQEDEEAIATALGLQLKSIGS